VKKYQANQLLTVSEIRDEYGISETTLYGVLKRGELAAKILGKRSIRIRREDLHEWIYSLRQYADNNHR
jgi:excisionase family DNA binding protein